MRTIVQVVQQARTGVVAQAGDLLVLVLVVTAVAERLVQGHSAASAAVAATWGLPLLARHRHPLLAPCATLLLIGTAGFIHPEAVANGTAMEFLLTLTAVWMLIDRNPGRRAVWALAPVTVAVAASVTSVEDLLFTALFLGGAAAAGAVHRRAATQTVTLDEQVAALELGRDAALADAVVAERARIARELHDIVAHSVSVMTVQAGAARMQLALDPAQALASVTAVEEATAVALADLHRLLGLLGEQPEALRGLADIDRLLAQVREAGLEVRFHREGDARPLPGGLDLALYRILQEALTNVLKHADGRRAEVTLGVADDEVALTVVSPLPGAAATSGQLTTAGVEAGQGHGLLGMRERAELYGGRVIAAPTEGAFVVDVRVPLP